MPNLLTFSRIALAAAFLGLVFREGPFPKTLALAAFLLGCATDWLDGTLARRWERVTPLGQLLDPIADKVLLFSAFLAFVQMGVLPAWMVVAMLAREVLITGFRLLAASRGVWLGATRGGKRKTVLQAVAVGAVLLYLIMLEGAPPPPIDPHGALAAIRVFMLVVVGWTLASGIAYTAKHWGLVLEERA